MLSALAKFNQADTGLSTFSGSGSKPCQVQGGTFACPAESSPIAEDVCGVCEKACKVVEKIIQFPFWGKSAQHRQKNSFTAEVDFQPFVCKKLVPS